MKRALCVILCIVCVVFFPFSSAGASGAFLIMDGRTATVLEQENGDVRLPMASTTKVMTALVVLENAELSEAVTIPKEAVGVEGSSLYVKQGEIYTVEELLYGLMLQSANDSAVALAVHVGGSIDGFVSLMNDRSNKLGLTNTRFMNPHGLPADGHYTTARELALIMRAAMNHSDFRTITATKRYDVKNQTIVNHNKLLTLYSSCIGGKTGYTIAAGRCLVTVAQKKEVPLICVTLGRRDDWSIHANAYEKWFPEIKNELIIGKEEFSVQLPLAGNGTVTAVNRDSIAVGLFRYDGSAAVRVLGGPFVYGNKDAGAVVGTVEYWYKKVKIWESPLVLTDKIRVEPKKELFITRIIRFFRRLFLKKS